MRQSLVLADCNPGKLVRRTEAFRPVGREIVKRCECEPGKQILAAPRRRALGKIDRLVNLPCRRKKGQVIEVLSGLQRRDLRCRGESGSRLLP